MTMGKIGGRKSFFWIYALIIILTASQLTSAGFSDWFGKITGAAASNTTTVSITIANNAPTIAFVSDISSVTPTESQTKTFTFTFNATDTDGVENLNNSEAIGTISKSGENTRSNTSCIAVTDDGANVREYHCTIGLEYWDGAGSWAVNATISDINSAPASNTSTSLTYISLLAMVMSPTALTWPSLGLASTNTGAFNDPIIINNTGNDESLSINVTAFNLMGNTTSTEIIPAENFTISNISPGCAGNVLVNNSDVNITSAILEKGNNSIATGNSTSGQEELFFCLKGLPSDISSQDYTSGSAWNIEIIT
jgi:hypothetical protein